MSAAEVRLARAVGARIAAHRITAGLSKRGLSRVIGCTASFPGLIESGKRIPSLQCLFRIASAVGCDAANLIPSRAP